MTPEERLLEIAKQWNGRLTDIGPLILDAIRTSENDILEKAAKALEGAGAEWELDAGLLRPARAAHIVRSFKHT